MTHLFYDLVVPALVLNLVCYCLWSFRKGFHSSMIKLCHSLKGMVGTKFDDWAKPFGAAVWLSHHTVLVWGYLNKPGVCWDILVFSVLVDVVVLYVLYGHSSKKTKTLC